MYPRKFRIVATFVNTDLKQCFLMQYICNLYGSPMSVTILTGLPKIVHIYRHETVTECNFHIAAMLLLYSLPNFYLY